MDDLVLSKGILDVRHGKIISSIPLQKQLLTLSTGLDQFTLPACQMITTALHLIMMVVRTLWRLRNFSFPVQRNNMKHNDDERRLWVLNDEGLYLEQQRSKWKKELKYVLDPQDEFEEVRIFEHTVDGEVYEMKKI